MEGRSGHINRRSSLSYPAQEAPFFLQCSHFSSCFVFFVVFLMQTRRFPTPATKSRRNIQLLTNLQKWANLLCRCRCRCPLPREPRTPARSRHSPLNRRPSLSCRAQAVAHRYPSAPTETFCVLENAPVPISRATCERTVEVCRGIRRT